MEALLHGEIKRIFAGFLLPSTGGALIVTLYSFVDTIAIGQGVGPYGAAACAVLLPIFAFATFAGVLCGVGGSVLMSKAKGGGNQEKGNAYYTASLLLVGIMTLAVWSGTYFFQEEIYRFFGADDTLLPYAMEYGTVIALTQPSFILTSFFANFLRNDGVPGFVMKATILGAAVNIFGDWFFVFPLGMGMFGAALATALGSGIQVVLMIGYLFTKRCGLKLVRPYRLLPALRKIFFNGFGTAFSEIALIVVTFAANNQIMRYADNDALAVYGMVCTIAALFIHIYTGVGQAAQPIASANYGAGQTARCWAVYRLGLGTILVLGILFTALCLLWPGEITRLFMKATPEVMAIAPQTFRVYTLSFLPLGLNIFLSVYLQSILRSRAAAVIAVVRGLVLNCALLYLLPCLWGAQGLWIAFPAAEGIVAAGAVFYVRRLDAGEKRKMGGMSSDG